MEELDWKCNIGPIEIKRLVISSPNSYGKKTVCLGLRPLMENWRVPKFFQFIGDWWDWVHKKTLET